MSELTKRILFGVPAAALFLFITYIGGFYFVGFITVIGILIQREFAIISDHAGFKTDALFLYLIGLWILWLPYIPTPSLLGLGIFLLFVAVQIFKTAEQGLQSLLATSFAGIYAPLGLLTLLLTRELGTPETGFILTLSLVLMIWGNDVFAYFGGKSMGKHRMAPTISPNKTWEGFGFGILGAATGLVITMYCIPINYPATLLQMLPAILLVSIFGPIGDLTASRLKRAAKVKDTSNLLPGHGGFFDRFDALILAAPAFYLYIEWLKYMEYVTF